MSDAPLSSLLDGPDAPTTYREAWWYAGLLTGVVALYLAVYALVADAGVLRLGAPVPLLAPAFTLGYAHRTGHRRGRLLSAGCAAASLAVVALAPPLRAAVRDVGGFLLLPAWLVVLVGLLGYASPSLSR